MCTLDYAGVPRHLDASGSAELHEGLYGLQVLCHEAKRSDRSSSSSVLDEIILLAPHDPSSLHWALQLLRMTNTR